MKIKKHIDKILIVILAIIFFVFGFYNKEKLNKADKNLKSSKVYYKNFDYKNSSKNKEDKNKDKNNKSENNKINNFIYVDISGCIKKSGVYKIKEGSRLKDLVNLAGGLCSNVDLKELNLSKKLQDEEKIYIYKQEENLNSKKNNTKESITNKNSKININIADINLLTTIPGIGKSRAEEIINYRKNKKFDSIEEIKNISGIGEKTFEKLKPFITVSN